jgi:hypothetical protein
MKSSRSVSRAACLILKYGLVLLFACGVRAQTPRPTPPDENTSPGKRPHVATMRATDSSDGSRVSLTSDHSLTDYEAYRTGDRFYVRIPSTEVSSGSVARGRGFEDAKVQRNGDSTVLSFRLQPGATARVEQRANELEVVFKAAGTTAGNTNSSVAGSEASSPVKPGPVQTNRNVRVNTPPRTKAVNPSPTATSTATAANTAKGAPSPTPARANSGSATKNSQTQSLLPGAAASPANQSSQAAPRQSSGDAGLNLKERLRYLLLLASLNPIPMVIALVLLVLIALLLFQRRRSKGPPRVRPRKKRVASATSPVTVAERGASTPVVTAEPLAAATMSDAGQALPNGDQDPRIARVSDEVKRVLGGEDYDRDVIADGDAATRQLVAAELLSALASRNGARHDRAREIFMNHGYFEDATRDLRIAESPAERAAAARRLSFVRDREATPHLAAALQDSAPEVRRAAVEALLDQGDPGATAPLNDLMRVETDRNVPHTLIRRAIDACATSGHEQEAALSAASSPLESFSMPPEEFRSEPVEPEREVIEI